MPRDVGAILKEDRTRLTHMLESAQRSLRIAKGLTCDSLASDEVRLLAVVKSIEIIGEASTKVSAETRALMPAVEWRGIRTMRNRMIHGYGTIMVSIVWETLQQAVPPLIAELERALAAWPLVQPVKE